MREFTDGDFPHAEDFDSLTRALASTAAVLSGCSVTDGGTNDMSVSIDSGEIYAGGGVVSVASSSETLKSSDGTYRRYDLITADSTGATNYVAGTASSTPKAPDIPAGEALLAIIQVDAGVSGVTNDDIKDSRGVISIPAAYLPDNSIGAAKLDGSYPDGSIALADLGFDPATQTELDNHAGADGAHHSRPAAGIGMVENAGTFDVEMPWVEDGNSPVSATNVGSISYTLANSYDEVRIVIHDLVGEGTTQGDLQLTVNGDTGTNYDVIDNTGTATTGASYFRPIINVDLSARPISTGIVSLSGVWTDSPGLTMSSDIGAFGNRDITGQNKAVTSPLGSFTLQHGGVNITADVEVYGRNVA